MSAKPTLRERWNYAFDNYMSRGTLALIGGLGLISLVIILLAATLIVVGGQIFNPEGESRLTFIEASWRALMRTLDAGTMGADAGWGFRLLMFVVTLGGVFIISTLIGVLTAGVEGKMEQLRKGRSRVLENGHILILGWSSQIFTILSELMAANENQHQARIVILADRDKVEMDDELRERIQFRGNTRIICRSGSPIDLNDLELVSPHSARSIIVLPPENDDPDSDVIKIVLALTNNPNRRSGRYHIVTQVRDQKNLAIIKMIAGEDLVQPVVTGDLIARVVAQTSRQSGLSIVYTELMNFGGDEIYFKEEPSLVGRTFGDCLNLYEDSSVMGMRFADGRVSLMPPLDTPFAPGDQLFALSADDDTIQLSGRTLIPVDDSAIKSNGGKTATTPEKALMLGWNRSAATIISELDHYVGKGSRLLLIADPEVSAESARTGEAVRALSRRMKNQDVDFQKGDTTDRELLEQVHAADYDHVIVLSYAGLDVQEADARTLLTLLHLRAIAERDETPFSIISEMLDLRNRELAEIAHVDDFIVSDHLVSLMMAQIAENSDLFAVFEDIFDPEGAEIYLKPVSDYVNIDRPVNFYTVVEAARRRGQVAFGYRRLAETGEKENAYGIHTNPKKLEMISFSPDDRIIVIAED